MKTGSATKTTSTTTILTRMTTIMVVVVAVLSGKRGKKKHTKEDEEDEEYGITTRVDITLRFFTRAASPLPTAISSATTSITATTDNIPPPAPPQRLPEVCDPLPSSPRCYCCCWWCCFCCCPTPNSVGTKSPTSIVTH